jgi:hypothetical protein
MRIEKDDFTGLRKINSSFYGFDKFISFDGPTDIYLRYMRDNTGISDAFDLLYLELENGQGSIVIRVCSSVAKYSGNTEYPHWSDNWPMIVDGERVSLNSSSIYSFERDYELKVYDLPIDIFNKLCNAKEIKFSLRGRNKKIEGVFSNEHQIIMKAFEQYCFGDENEGKKLLESVESSIIQNNNENQSENQIITNMSDEEKSTHEKKIIELLQNNKLSDANAYYASNFGCDSDIAKKNVIEIANKNGLFSVILKQRKRNQRVALLFYIPILCLLIYTGFIPIHPDSIFNILGPLLTLVFIILVIRAIVIQFKK